MNPEEKYLYHQIHPLKLLTDWVTGIVALYPLWQHKLVLALVIALIPPPIASFLLMRFAGYIAMVVGAWTHIIWLIAAAPVIVLFGWFRGRIFPEKSI